MYKVYRGLCRRSIGFGLQASRSMEALQGAHPRRPVSNMAEFRHLLKNSNHITVLTGAGVSAESGIPTFRGDGGLWRTYRSQDLATPSAFDRNPSLVWEFYHYRREMTLTKQPNKAHIAIAEYEQRMKLEGKELIVITQNIDEFHKQAGSENIIELHGSMFKTRCTVCGDVTDNRDSPICPALYGKGAPDLDTFEARIDSKDLPHCSKCNGLLRPHVVWFGEGLEEEVVQKTYEQLSKCDVCLLIGTSSVVYPAAMYAPQLAANGTPVAEFNLEYTPATQHLHFYFEGPCGTTIPQALAP